MVSVSSPAEHETRVSLPEEWLGEAVRLQEEFCREIRRADAREVVLALATRMPPLSFKLTWEAPCESSDAKTRGDMSQDLRISGDLRVAL
jgi:hypothetical protein